MIVLLGFMLASFSQVVNEKITQDENGKMLNSQHKLKGDGAVFYYEDFDWGNPADPKGWSLPDGWSLIDLTGTDSTESLGLNFMWMAADSMVASWTEEPPFQSTTASNGYLVNPLDIYNTELGDAELWLDNGIQFAPIDCSAHTSVIYRMEHNFMNYSTVWTMSIFVSVDEGVHWATYDAGEGCGHKERPLDANPGQAVIYEANISDVAAGADNVWIKIHWEGTRLYYWVIDDVTLSEAYDNDLQIEHRTLEYDLLGVDDVNESVFYMIPKTQLGGGGFDNFEAGVENFGEFDQYGVKLDVEVIKNNQQVFNAQSDPIDLGANSDPDTLYVYDKYTPEEFGHYKINMNIIANAEDNNPADNLYSREFHVTDSVYSRSDDTWEFNWTTGHEQYLTLTEGWVDFSIFPIRDEVAEASSLSVYLTGGDETIDFRFVVYDPNVEDGELPYELLVSDFLTIDSSMYFTWITMEFEKDGESEFLQPGLEYYAGVQYWYDTNIRYGVDSSKARRNRNLRIGSDRELRNKDAISGYST
ncbi:hypothetical protein ACFLSI_02335, partial [Bacteroidota bacterium]